MTEPPRRTRDTPADPKRYAAIREFEHDPTEDEWIALLECGHRQHVRHNPPWVNRAWIRTQQGRSRAIGQPLRCRLCEQASG